MVILSIFSSSISILTRKVIFSDADQLTKVHITSLFLRFCLIKKLPPGIPSDSDNDDDAEVIATRIKWVSADVN